MVEDEGSGLSEHRRQMDAELDKFEREQLARNRDAREAGRIAQAAGQPWLAVGRTAAETRRV